MMNFKYHLAAFVMAACMTTGCADDVRTGNLNETVYETGDGTAVGYITDSQGKRTFSNVEFRTTGTETFTLHTAATRSTALTVTAVYDETVLEAYNKQNNTKFEAFPQADLTLSDNGTFTLEVGKQVSLPLTVSLKSDGTRNYETVYAIPLRLSTKGGTEVLPETDRTRIIFVKDLTGLPDATKYVDGVPGIKVFSCMEVNDTNPLNNLNFTLKSSGKPLVDAVILFSSNINYDERTGRVYIYHNENCSAILNNYEKYIKPLHDRGIKVILSILGNHDRAGVANLSDETARAFAKEIKACCDAYHLDGVFLDDEYSNYEKTDITPGFVYPSSAACARLYYEIKKIQPERWNVTYVYSTTRSLPAVDDTPSGEFIDYGLHDYGGSSDLSSNYPGMLRSGMGLYSQEFAQGRFAYISNLRQMRAAGYGAHMIFAMDPYRYNVASQISAMRDIADAFYDDELVVDKNYHPKDWK